MAEEYTPTTEDVRGRYKSGAWLWSDDQESARKPEVYAPRYFAEFDRWFAAEKAKWQAEAWEAGVQHAELCEGGMACDPRTANPYEKGSDDGR